MARRGKTREELASLGDFEEPVAPARDEQPEPEPEIVEDVAPVHGQVADEDRGAFALVTDQLEALRKNRKLEQDAAKKDFEAEEKRLLAERDALMRDLQRRDQAEAVRKVRAHVAEVRAQAAAEIPANPEDRRSDYHKKLLARLLPLIEGAKATQKELNAWTRRTRPSIATIASLTPDSVPTAWPQHQAARLLGLADTAGRVISDHAGLLEQVSRAIRGAERLAALEVIDGEEPDQRIRHNGILQELAYCQQDMTLALERRSANLALSLTQIKKDAGAFERRPGEVVIVLNRPDQGREQMRRERMQAMANPEPKRQSGVLSGLGIDTNIPPSV